MEPGFYIDGELVEFMELPLDHLKPKKKFLYVEPGYRLQKDLQYVDHKGVSRVIKAGYTFNGLSVPWFLWFLCPPGQPQALAAALIHDYYYEKHTVSRREADREFLQKMLQQGYYKFGAYRNYYAVRLFGWMCW